MPEESRNGIWIHRVASPAAVRPRQRRAVVRSWDNKENIPPYGVGAGRARRGRRSPLPEWYPRTPLQDITAVVNAIERRRAREQAARAAQGNTENPPPTIPPSSVTVESTPTCNITLSPVQHPLPTPSTSSISSSFLPTIYETPTTKLLQTEAEIEDRLCRSIEFIEKIVMKNLQKSIKKEPAIKRAAQRKILMSMR